MAKTPPFSVRLEDDLRAEAEEVAKEEDRKLGNLMVHALRFYLDHRKKRK